MSHRPTAYDDMNEADLDRALDHMRATGAGFDAAARYARQSRGRPAPVRYAGRRDAPPDDDFGEPELDRALTYLRQTGATFAEARAYVRGGAPSRYDKGKGEDAIQD